MIHDKNLLLIGLDPKVVDYAHLPVKLDEPTLRAGLATDEKRLRDLGYDARWLLVDRGETAEAVVSAALEEKTFDCILIGAGIRTIPPLFLTVRKARERGPREGAARQDLLQHRSRGHRGLRSTLGLTVVVLTHARGPAARPGSCATGRLRGHCPPLGHEPSGCTSSVQ